MKIIIAGAGAVGTHLAKLLVQENHDIILMDEDRNRLNEIKDNVELLLYTGNCTSLSDLSKVEVQGADLFIAVTVEESKNITACMLASNLGAKKTLARIDNHEYLLPGNIKFFEKLGVNSMIYPEMTAAKEIVSALKNPWTRAWWELSNSSIILSGAKIRENAPITNRYIYELVSESKKFHIVAIKRNNETLIPMGKDQVLPGDILYFTTLKQHLKELPVIMGKNSFETKNIIIMGGSQIALQTVKHLPDNINVKIVEKNRERAELLVEKTPSNVTIFHGDGRDSDFLVNEGIGETDAFLALTGNSEANILACIAAKQYGVKKTIAEVENLDYIALAERFNIGTVINKKLIAAGRIYELLLQADASNIKNLALANANVGEVVAHPNSKVTKKIIKNLKLPSDITLGALIRNGEPMLIDGDTLIQPYDKVVVFFLHHYSIKNIEGLFN